VANAAKPQPNGVRPSSGAEILILPVSWPSSSLRAFQQKL
jgi:hypothetical protein